MPVHVDSVIPVWLNDYNETVYIALTNQENWTYTNLVDSVLDPPVDPTSEELELLEAEWKLAWIAEFTKIANALNEWKNLNRETGVADLVSILFGAKTLKNLYEFPIDTDSYTPNSVIAIGSFFNLVSSRPVDFYKDYDNTVEMKSANIEADVTSVETAGSTEVGNLSSASRSLSASMKPYSHRLIFENIPITGISTKKMVRDYVFDELGYAGYYTQLNVGSLQIPPPLEE